MFRDAVPIVYVDDLPAALRFYRDLLGFTVTYGFPDGDPVFVALRLGHGAELALAAVTDGEPGSHGRPVRVGGARQFELCVYTDDVDAALHALAAQGVEVLAPPVDQPWGERMAYVADPAGTPVMICAAAGPQGQSAVRA